MKRYRILLLVWATILISAPCFAANGWYANPDGAGTVLTKMTRPTSSSSGVAFFLIDDTASAGTFSKAFNIQWARRLDLSLITDTNGTAGVCEVKIWETFADEGATVSASTGLPQISADVDGDGVQDNLTLNGSSANRRSLRNFMAYRISVEITVKPGAGEQCALKVQGY